MYTPVKIAHSSFIEGLHTAKNMASGVFVKANKKSLTTIAKALAYFTTDFITAAKSFMK